MFYVCLFFCICSSMSSNARGVVVMNLFRLLILNFLGGGASNLMRTVDDDNLIKICKKNDEDGELIEKMVSLSQGCIAHETLQVRLPYKLCHSFNCFFKWSVFRSSKHQVTLENFFDNDFSRV